MSGNASFTTLRRLANRTGLSAAWLKAEAEAGRIPSLKAGRYLRFNVQAVERVLAERTTRTKPAGVTQ